MTEKQTLEILPARCEKKCPEDSCRSMLALLLSEVVVAEVQGEQHAYVAEPEIHARVASDFIKRIALCSARQSTLQ